MDLFDAVSGRRSIRKYKPDSIPEEILQKVMEAVRWAPSWANTQCWEVIVVKDPKAKSEFIKAIPETNPAFPSLIQAPLILVLCGKKGVSGFYKGQPKTTKGDWLLFDTGLAMQNLCLAAHSLGLGTVIIGNFDHQKAAEILGTPQNIEVVVVTPLGYPLAEGGNPKRKEISEFVFYEKYPGKE